MHYDAIKNMKSNIDVLFKNVNNLGKLVDKVSDDVELVNQKLTEAEANMPISKDGPFNAILKPFFVSISIFPIQSLNVINK